VFNIFQNNPMIMQELMARMGQGAGVGGQMNAPATGVAATRVNAARAGAPQQSMFQPQMNVGDQFSQMQNRRNSLMAQMQSLGAGYGARGFSPMGQHSTLNGAMANGYAQADMQSQYANAINAERRRMYPQQSTNPWIRAALAGGATLGRDIQPAGNFAVPPTGRWAP
jgi:hypothetical protein